MRAFLFVVLVLLAGSSVNAQNRMPGRQGGQGQMSIARFYGKIVDASNNKGIDAASVQLIQSKFDSASGKQKDVSVAGQLTSKGNFSLENLSPFGKYRLLVTAIGYTPIDKAVQFDVKRGGNSSDMMNNLDKDLGNIKMEIDAQQLSEVKVVASKPMFQMGVDRKIFNVDKNIVTTGQTATEIMKNVPGVTV